MMKGKRELPEIMKAVRQHHADGKLILETMPLPEPGPGEVLVKMVASPINPSDLALLKGGYMRPNYPFTPGLEGSGVVVSSGGGLLAGLRNGKRVACSPDPGRDGTWAEYMKTSAMRTVPLSRYISLEQGAMMLVNPMTAMAFIYMAREGKHRALVNNAAASSLGKMLIRLSLKEGIPLINIVRNQKHVEELKSMGASYVLNSTDSSFDAELKQLAAKLGATLFLDAVSGDQTSVLLGAAPPGSTLVAYARLSGQSISADPGHFISEGKQITGFQLGNWLHGKNAPFKIRLISRVKRQMGATLSSRVSGTFEMDQAEQALLHYKRNMSSGKIILTLNQQD